MTAPRLVCDRLLLFAEFCAKTRCSPRKGRRIMASGEIGTIRIGGQVLVPESELERFLRERFTPAREGGEQRRPESVVAVLDRVLPRKRRGPG